MSLRGLQKLRGSGLFCSLSARRGLLKRCWGAGENGARVLPVASRKYSTEDVTHTGQKWEDSDYRKVRFVDRTKQVNQQFAIDLLAEEPVEVIKGTHTWCDGGRASLGHPKVYINLDKPEINDCGYCGKRFVAEKHKNLFPPEYFAAVAAE